MHSGRARGDRCAGPRAPPAPPRLYYGATSGRVRCSGVTAALRQDSSHTHQCNTARHTSSSHSCHCALAACDGSRCETRRTLGVSKHTTHKVTTRESRRGASDRSFTVASSCPAQPPRPMHHRALRDPPASSLRGFSWAVDGQWLLAGFRGWAHARTTTPQPNQPLKTSEIKRSAWKSSCNVHTPRRWCAKTSGSVHLSRK